MKKRKTAGSLRILPLLLAAAMIFAVLPIVSSASSKYDLNGDGVASIEDVTTLLDALAIGTDAKEYDLNGDAAVSIEDVTTLLDALSTGIAGEEEAVSDVLNNGNTYGKTGTSYESWTASGASGAVYTGQSAGSQGTIQLRSKDSSSGIVTTVSGGEFTGIRVTFNGTTTVGRIVDVYAKKTAYSLPADLYTDQKGVKIGSLTYDGTNKVMTLPVPEGYGFVGVRSNSGALYLDEIVFTWNGETDPDVPPQPTYETPEEIVNGLYELGYNAVLPGGPYTLTGVVTAVPTPYNAEYGNVTVTIVVNGMTDKPIDCFRLEGEGVEDVDVDDTVTVTGELKHYYTSKTEAYEFIQGCTLDELVKAELGPAPATVVEEQVDYPVIDTLWENIPQLAPGVKSTGDVEVLVIPVGFTNTDAKYTNAAVKDKLNKAFNGTKEDTGWYSLSGYYREVSFGQLNIHATVADIYNTGKAYDLKRGKPGADDYAYLEASLKAYDGVYDYSDFDADGDGCIDCVYLVYLAPYSTSEGDSDLWWAYTSYFSEDEETKLDGKSIFWYMWFSIEFFDEPIYNDDDVVDDLGVTINCETVIHETGHALGLDDYYDYKYGIQPGLGGLVMMDWNRGDHDPFSKAILGWINPTVLKAGEYEMTLSSYTATGDALFVAREGNGSYFDEFFIITYYTPDGVNALKAAKAQELGYDMGILSQPGILVYHVNSTLKDDLSNGVLYDIYNFNNCEEVNRLIKVVEKEPCVEEGYAADYEYVLFGEGDALKLVWNDGTRTHLTMNVDSVSENEAAVSITWG